MYALVLVSVWCLGSSYVRSVNIGFIYYDPSHNDSNLLETTMSYLEENGINVPKGVTVREIYLSTEELTHIIHTVCDEARHDTTVFVVFAPCSFLNVLEGTLAHLSIPIIGINTDQCPQQLSHTAIVRLQTSATSVHDAILAILQMGGFTQTAILTDQSDKDISIFRSALSHYFYESYVSYLTKSDGDEESARVVTSWLSGVTITDAATTCLILILEEASLSAVSRHLKVSEVALVEHIAVVVSDTDVTSALDEVGRSVFHDVLWLVEMSPGNTVEQRLDVQIGESFRILFEAIKSLSASSASSPNETIQQCGDKIINISSTTSLIKDALNKMNMNNTMSDSDDLYLGSQYDVMRLTFENQTWSSDQIAHWSHREGLVVPDDCQLFLESTKGLGNITLRIGTTEAPPFMMKLPNDTGWEGFCVDILDELASRLNFRYKLIQSPDKLWGTVDEEGNWNGVVEMVRKEDVDFGIGPISLTSEREQVIDFTKPYMEEGAGIVIKRFEDKNSKIFRMFKPFSESVWLTIAAAVVVVGFTLAIVNRLSPGQEKEDEGEGGMKEGTERIRTSDNIWVVYESYMEQGIETSPPNISGRFILGFWWIFTILMVASYKANLVAFLTVSFTDKPINSVHDLADQTDVIPLVKQGSNLYQELKKGETETFRKLWSMMQTAPSVATSEEALKLVLTGGYAFLTDQSQIEFLRTLDCENLMSAETPFNVGGLGFIVPESSSLLEVLSFNLIQLQEAGLTRKWRQRWWSSSNMCPSQTSASNVQSLELESTGGPFLVFAGSTTLALVCLGVECIWWKRKGCGKRKRQEADDNSST